MKALWQAFSSDESGQGLVEYALIIALVAVGLIAILLVLMMAVGSVVLWIGIPVGWVWVASRTVKTSQPSLGPPALYPGIVWPWARGRMWMSNDGQRCDRARA